MGKEQSSKTIKKSIFFLFYKFRLETDGLCYKVIFLLFSFIDLYLKI